MTFVYRNFDIRAVISDIVTSSKFEVAVLAKLIGLRENFRDELDKTHEMIANVVDTEEGAKDRMDDLNIYCDELFDLFVVSVAYIKNFESRFEVDGRPEAILKRMWEEMV